VRQEVGRKWSFMGIYANVMIVPKLPALLPKICLVLCFEGLRKYIPVGEVKLINPGEEPVTFPMSSMPNQKLGGKAYLFVNLSPYVIKSPGKARFEVRFGGEGKPSIVHTVKIEVAKKPEESTGEQENTEVIPQEEQKKPREKK
jgi:hypothetical protein